MKKKTRTMLIMVLVLIVLVVAYVLLQVHNEKAAETEDSGNDNYEVTNFDADSITDITYTYDGVTTQFRKENDTWVNADDSTMELDQDKVANLITEVNNISSENRITDVEDLSQYGFDPAVVTVCMKSDTDSYTILFGDYNDAIYKNYISLEGENTVYTTIKAKCNAFEVPVSDFIAAEDGTEETAETVTETAETGLKTAETVETQKSSETAETESIEE